jgi:FkbM family methyltransferase
MQRNIMSAAQQTPDHLKDLDIEPELKRRILMTIGCRDSDAIPKVPHAGEVFAEGDLRYQLMHNGVRVIEDGYCGSWMTEIIRQLKGHHEPQEEKLFHEILKYLSPGATMIEVGSYWAYYSLWFRQALKNATNYMIEPDPNNLAVGKLNFAINSAEGKFFQYSIGRSSFGPRPFRCESDGQEHPVAEISIDDFASSVGLNRIDLLLADVQGAELPMLEGAIKCINSGKLRFLVLSTHHHSISGHPLTHQQCLQFLRERGAHIIAAHNVTESYSGDGLIVASFDERDRNIPEVQVSKNHPTNSLFRELEYDLYEVQQQLNTPIPKRIMRKVKRLVLRLIRV